MAPSILYEQLHRILFVYSRPGVLVLVNDADWELRYVSFSVIVALRYYSTRRRNTASIPLDKHIVCSPSSG